ncbi:hypothetical protein [Halorubrum sp. F4]|uniref:hypothetical protein n=1 Tax=Halorubrum sp. F4 TaxID=2989715 RepID=UPI00247FF974|nr:hypothetical protein [Halorubrum sp. F4]
MSSHDANEQTETVAPRNEHPIDTDIVRAAADDCTVDPTVLNRVLAACSRLWDPHRDKFRTVLNAFHQYNEHFVFIETTPDPDRIIVVGTSLTPSQVVQRIDLEAMLETETVTPVGMALAVKVAHAMQAEQLVGYAPENCLVIRDC